MQFCLRSYLVEAWLIMAEKVAEESFLWNIRQYIFLSGFGIFAAPSDKELSSCPKKVTFVEQFGV